MRLQQRKCVGDEGCTALPNRSLHCLGVSLHCLGVSLHCIGVLLCIYVVVYVDTHWHSRRILWVAARRRAGTGTRAPPSPLSPSTQAIPMMDIDWKCRYVTVLSISIFKHTGNYSRAHILRSRYIRIHTHTSHSTVSLDCIHCECISSWCTWHHALIVLRCVGS